VNIIFPPFVIIPTYYNGGGDTESGDRRGIGVGGGEA